MQTEPQRNHTIDVARALSVLVVVIFHGFIYKASMKPDGTLEAGLWTPPTWVWGLSWVLMSMPLFFACGGFSNALIVDKMRRRGTGFSHYLANRGRRLTGGLALFVTFFAVIASAAAWLGHGLLAAELSRSLMFLLWFISVYLVIVLVAPFSVTLHDRFGAWVIVAMLIGIVVVDRAWLGFGRNDIGQINMFLVWPLCHQLGIGYQRGWFREGPRRFAWGVLVGSALAIVVLIFFFGYPASAVGFANAPIANHLPPTLAMALLGAAQVAGMGLVERSGVFASLPARTEAALARLSALMMTVYLWHVPCMLVGGAGLILLARLVRPGGVPAHPAAGHGAGPLPGAAQLCPHDRRHDARLHPRHRRASPAARVVVGRGRGVGRSMDDGAGIAPGGCGAKQRRRAEAPPAGPSPPAGGAPPGGGGGLRGVGRPRQLSAASAAS